MGRKVGDLENLWGRKDLSSDDVDARQALQRVAIWSNYSTSMARTRIFVPPDKAAHFRSEGALPSNVLQWQTPTALAILAIDSARIVVAQPLVGGSDARFYRPSELLGDDELEPGVLKELKIHEEVRTAGHKWQWNLYEAITKMGIPRNEGLTTFRGYPTWHLDKDGRRPQPPASGSKPAKKRSGSKPVGKRSGSRQ